MSSYDLGKAVGGMMTDWERRDARLEAVMKALDGHGPRRWSNCVEATVLVGFDADGRYTVSGDDTDPDGTECAGNMACEGVVATLLVALKLDDIERARFELAREVWGGRKLHPAIEEELNERRKRPTVSETEMLVKRLTARYARVKKCREADLRQVEIHGTTVTFGMVGRNASHEFYLGWDTEGNLWKSASGDDYDEDGNEIEWISGEDTLRRNGWMYRPATEVQPHMDLGYIGHY